MISCIVSIAKLGFASLGDGDDSFDDVAVIEIDSMFIDEKKISIVGLGMGQMEGAFGGRRYVGFYCWFGELYIFAMSAFTHLIDVVFCSLG